MKVILAVMYSTWAVVKIRPEKNLGLYGIWTHETIGIVSSVVSSFHIFFSGHESEGEESEPDLFQCGKCKRMFTSLQKYLKHKAAKDCVQLQTHGQTSAVSPVTNGEVMTVDSGPLRVIGKSPTTGLKKKATRSFVLQFVYLVARSFISLLFVRCFICSVVKTLVF